MLTIMVIVLGKYILYALQSHDHVAVCSLYVVTFVVTHCGDGIESVINFQSLTL